MIEAPTKSSHGDVKPKQLEGSSCHHVTWRWLWAEQVYKVEVGLGQIRKAC